MKHRIALRSQRYTFNGRESIDRYGNPCTIWDAKRHLIPRKSYPYASERQVKRQQRHQDYLCNKLIAIAMYSNRDIKYPKCSASAIIRLAKQLLQAETGN